MRKTILIIISAILFFQNTLVAQKKIKNSEIRKLVEEYKKDPRGPYRDIRWFCPDGSIIPPKESCKTEGGIQHARYKGDVEKLGERNHIFLGQILAYTSPQEFWDKDNFNARLKQYQLEKYLRAVDQGWIMQEGQYYRGALQVEDEEEWGLKFFRYILQKPGVITKHFFLVREAVKDVPHQGDKPRSQNIRALSKSISNAYEPFFDLRVKMHAQPNVSDLEACNYFLVSHRKKMDEKLVLQFEDMLDKMAIEYEELKISGLKKYLNVLSAKPQLQKQLRVLIKQGEDKEFSEERIIAISDLLASIRNDITTVKGRRAKTIFLDLSVDLERIFIHETGRKKPKNLSQLINRIYYSAKAAMACGYIEKWEWKQLSTYLIPPDETQINFLQLSQYYQHSRRLLESAVGMNQAIYQKEVERYGGFEPLAYGFIDNRVRSSVLLTLGRATDQLGNFVAEQGNLSNEVMNIPRQSAIRGINPGYAFGTLVVVDGPLDWFEILDDHIYVFNRTPSDLKPVAGIASVGEGNLVSHIQLLARNLGIPNAIISQEQVTMLRPYCGQKVFYAVSEKGKVIMKREAEMNNAERRLVQQKNRNNKKVNISTRKINLQEQNVLDLRDIGADDSGKICGPKAANLGQLKKQFPEMVVEGIVIPFGVFRTHLDQNLPNSNQSYWEFLNNVFSKAEKIKDPIEEEEFVLKQLAVFRKKIKDIPLYPDFIADLKQQFKNVLGKPIGKVPVFVRSDTNMEDLKEFTGSGLNLTLFNVLDEATIIQGVREVWASPFKERSYRWRQKFMLNPQNVYPSILIIPSVNVDYSGVVITTGISSGSPNDLSIAFSRGAGGAVEGQAAESYLLKPNGENILLYPARESKYRVIPPSGGSYKLRGTFEKAILNKKNFKDLRALAHEVKEKMSNTAGLQSVEAFDIELGFKNNRIWLFQIRPFVENKNAKVSAYLKSLDSDIPKGKIITTSSLL